MSFTDKIKKIVRFGKPDVKGTDGVLDEYDILLATSYSSLQILRAIHRDVDDSNHCENAVAPALDYIEAEMKKQIFGFLPMSKKPA